MMTIFSKIIRGEIPCYKIAEDENFFAFLDINPMTKGHTLVIPKIEEDYLFNLEDELLGKMMVFAKKVAVAIRQSTSCTRVGVAVLGMEVPHAHIHLVPINKESDLNFRNKKLKLKPEEMEAIAQSIRKELSQK
ncbi:MAG TPA: HIT family protein [Paludibacter sp.]|nr:HIT family protein [Paludibacter sp.]